MIHDPQFEVTCDCGEECGEREHLTGCALANGCYDTRNIPGELTRLGWLVDGDTTISPECIDTYEAAKEKKDDDDV